MTLPASTAPLGLEDLRYQGLVRFASLLESQTRSRLFTRNIGDLIQSINAEIAENLDDCIRQLQKTGLDPDEKQRLIDLLDISRTRSSRMNLTMELLLKERNRQWEKSEDNLKQIMLDFSGTVDNLAHTLIEKDLFERQSTVLESIILSHEKVAQWKLFVQEILSGFHSIFPFNFFFIAFAEEHGLSLFVYFLGEYSDEVKQQVRDQLVRDTLATLNLPVDAPLDIEEFQIAASGRYDSIDDIKMITVPVPELEMLNLAGMLGVAYGSLNKLSAQEASVIRSILAVMVMVVGSSKALSRTLSELEYYSTHDPLTGLYNRRYFNEMLDYEIGRSERHGHEFSILMLDLDDFKDINDTYGHPCGDTALIGVADALHNVVRKGDLATRIGGDEFAIILTETNKEGGMIVAEKLRSELRDVTFSAPNDKSFHITTSIGIVTYPQDAKNLSDLMTGVDIGLYRAKKLGKDTVCSIDQVETQIQENRVIRDQAESLRNSLSEGRIVPFFQPIIDCKTGKVFAYETLARLNESDGSTVSAAMFIETIEKYGLGRELDRIMIGNGLKAMKEKIRNGDPDIKLFINLSAQEIQGRGILGYAEQMCQEIGIPPKNVVFELLERDAVGDMTHMRKFLTDLRKKGFSFALDDFGSGYNSFHYLRELHFDFVKLDGSFVRNILNSRIDHALVSNLSRLCQDLGILMVAEYVESKEIMEAIQAMGVDYAQGYYLGLPASHMP
ncbi:MAG TPA: bifunctional diguanylate cyclase/phosphodiesterase [Gallionella sp.]|nr:bifunctional diguanylate cyclase/phosphodiesterase [Gallionella sp.]